MKEVVWKPMGKSDVAQERAYWEGRIDGLSIRLKAAENSISTLGFWLMFTGIIVIVQLAVIVTHIYS